MTGEPVPTWARVIAVVVGVTTALFVVPTVVLGAVSLASSVGQIRHTTTIDLGPVAPRLQVDVRFGSVTIAAARDGQIVVRESRSAGAITRAAAAAALRRIAVDVSRQGDVVVVEQPGTPMSAPEVNSSSTIAIEVPARTDVDVRNVGSLRIQGTDGTVHVHGSGSVELSDATLRGSSAIDAPVGEVRMTDVTVAGSAVVTIGFGGVRFSGRLAPGGSALDIEDSAGDVSVALPLLTDARAVITTDMGDFHPNGPWLFTPDSPTTPRQWTADLVPNPTGTVTVRTRLGAVTFVSR